MFAISNALPERQFFFPVGRMHSGPPAVRDFFGILKCRDDAYIRESTNCCRKPAPSLFSAGCDFHSAAVPHFGWAQPEVSRYHDWWAVSACSCALRGREHSNWARQPARRGSSYLWSLPS